MQLHRYQNNYSRASKLMAKGPARSQSVRCSEARLTVHIMAHLHVHCIHYNSHNNKELIGSHTSINNIFNWGLNPSIPYIMKNIISKVEKKI